MPTDIMTKGEREQLARLIRQREKLAKTTATERAAYLRAAFEVQLDTAYSYTQDETWKRAVANAQDVVAAAQAEIARRSHELGIPKRFAPSSASVGTTGMWAVSGNGQISACSHTGRSKLPKGRRGQRPSALASRCRPH